MYGYAIMPEQIGNQWTCKVIFDVELPIGLILLSCTQQKDQTCSVS
jgi:hypothetical protein